MSVLTSISMLEKAWENRECSRLLAHQYKWLKYLVKFIIHLVRRSVVSHAAKDIYGSIYRPYMYMFCDLFLSILILQCFHLYLHMILNSFATIKTF